MCTLFEYDMNIREYIKTTFKCAQPPTELRIIVAKSSLCGKICATIYFCLYIYCKRCIDIAITTRHK